LLPETERFLQTILSRGPVAVRCALEAIRRGLDVSLEEGERLEADLFALVATTQGMEEGMTAFLEKRKPEFTGHQGGGGGGGNRAWEAGPGGAKHLPHEIGRPERDRPGGTRTWGVTSSSSAGRGPRWPSTRGRPGSASSATSRRSTSGRPRSAGRSRRRGF